MKIDRKDLKIERFRSSGKGGQNVNKVETAIRITHLPTGIVATSQDERSQSRNYKLAMETLIARVLDYERKVEKSAEDAERNRQLQSGRVRTYHYPTNTVIDHRRGTKAHNLKEVLDGNLDLIYRFVAE